MRALLETEDLVKYYGDGDGQIRAIDHTSISVERGEFAAIVGRSGSGKSTLLHMLGGLDRPDSGKVYIEGRDIFALKDERLAVFRRRKIGFIFQDYNLLPSLNVWENIVLPIGLDGKRVNRDYVMDIVKNIGMEERLKATPGMLSGGQKQRVASARAIITNPKLILADEPTGALDSKSSRMLLESFNFLNTELLATILMVTHDAFTASYASRVIFIKDGKIFNEIRKGESTRKEFFDKIIDVVTLLGGDLNNAL